MLRWCGEIAVAAAYSCVATECSVVSLLFFVGVCFHLIWQQPTPHRGIYRAMHKLHFCRCRVLYG